MAGVSNAGWVAKSKLRSPYSIGSLRSKQPGFSGCYTPPGFKPLSEDGPDVLQPNQRLPRRGERVAYGVVKFILSPDTCLTMWIYSTRLSL